MNASICRMGFSSFRELCAYRRLSSVKKLHDLHSQALWSYCNGLLTCHMCKYILENDNLYVWNNTWVNRSRGCSRIYLKHLLRLPHTHRINRLLNVPFQTYLHIYEAEWRKCSSSPQTPLFPKRSFINELCKAITTRKHQMNFTEIASTSVLRRNFCPLKTDIGSPLN